MFTSLSLDKPGIWASLVAQLVKNPPATWETWVQSLGWEDPLEEGMATHCSTLAWRITWTVQSMELQKVGHNLATFTFFRILNSSAGIPSPPLALLATVLPKAHLSSHSRMSGSE